jgi:hypothetical protein
MYSYVYFDAALVLAFLGILACLCLAPFLVLDKLLETRNDCNSSLIPVLASRAIGSGVRIEVIGSDRDPIAESLVKFASMIGHGYDGLTRPDDKEGFTAVVCYCVLIKPLMPVHLSMQVFSELNWILCSTGSISNESQKIWSFGA